MAQFLQSSPPSKVNRVARRSDNAEAAFAIYGWGLPIAKGAAQTIKVQYSPEHVSSSLL